MANSEVQALLDERAGYLVYGRADRAAQVDAVLARLGYAVEDGDDAPPVEEAGGGSARSKSGRRG